MEVLILWISAIALPIGWIGSHGICDENVKSTNASDLNKDMYVIHAMVYQVGIVTNATGDEASNGTIGNQEALTLYHTNGSNIDLSGLPTPLMTNVTAQSLVGVAPKTAGNMPWSALDLDHLTDVQQTSPTVKSGDGVGTEMLTSTKNSTENNTHRKVRRSSYNFNNIYKRDVTEDNGTVKIVKGTAEIPEAAGVKSLVIPPLLILNNSMSGIPVPIPNTSVIHYAKINTLIRNADSE